MSKIIQLIGEKENMFALMDDGTVWRRYEHTKHQYSSPTYKWTRFIEEGLPNPDVKE